jgi:hypothetical protein
MSIAKSQMTSTKVTRFTGGGGGGVGAGRGRGLALGRVGRALDADSDLLGDGGGAAYD